VGSIILFETTGKDGYRAIVLQTASGRLAAEAIRCEHHMTFPLEQRLPATEPDSDPPPPYDHARLAKERSVRGQFLRDVMAAANLSEQDRHSIMRAGLLALDGHDDLEVR
jgi:hypothetical protein